MKNVLIIASVWPEPGSSAAGVRMHQWINFFTAHTHQVSYWCTASYSEHSSTHHFPTLNIQAIKLNDHSFDHQLKALNPDVVFFDRFMMEEQFGWRVANVVPGALRLLNTEDLHSLRKSREEAYKNNERWTPEYWMNHVVTRREVAAIYRCDLSFIISAYELNLLGQHLDLPQQLLCHHPFVRSNEALTKVSYNKTNSFVSLGNFKHQPNRIALRILLNEIWPQIKQQIPEAILRVYGAYPDSGFDSFNQKNNVMIMGRAHHLNDVFSQARVLLAPLVVGAGLKGKLFEAMYYGVPSVTTSIGVEGMNNSDDWGGCVADDWQTFTQHSVKLYQDEAVWVSAQQQAQLNYLNYPTEETQFLHIHNLLQNLLAQLEAHRNGNFIGKMLLHHRVKSTQYMSLWIEAKNKQSNKIN